MPEAPYNWPLDQAEIDRVARSIATDNHVARHNLDATVPLACCATAVNHHSLNCRLVRRPLQYHAIRLFRMLLPGSLPGNNVLGACKVNQCSVNSIIAAWLSLLVSLTYEKKGITYICHSLQFPAYILCPGSVYVWKAVFARIFTSLRMKVALSG
jgi:hypothetical protein